MGRRGRYRISTKNGIDSLKDPDYKSEFKRAPAFKDK